MAQKLPSLNVLKVFDVAATRLSFKQAAEDLCLSPSAVSHQIKVLETQLGLPLFLRLPRGIELTEAGQRYHRDIKKVYIYLNVPLNSFVKLARMGVLRLAVFRL